METVTTPHQLNLIFANGALSGVMFYELIRIMDGESIVAERIEHRDVPIELSAAILGTVNTAALTRIAELETELAAALSAPQPEAPPAELTIRAWQAKAILTAQGLLDEAEAVIAAMPEGLPKIATISAWANNADFPRNSQTIIGLASALGLTDTQLDEMFAAGAALTI